MVKEFSVVSELKTIREQKSRLSERENEISTPIIFDLSYIKIIYEWFCEIRGERNCPGRNESVHIRKQFIFIILFLYSPSTLAGGRMPVGLRDAIAEAVDLKDITFISHNVETVVFMYQNYKDFRQDIEYLYTEIINRLKIKGLINCRCYHSTKKKAGVYGSGLSFPLY